MRYWLLVSAIFATGCGSVKRSAQTVTEETRSTSVQMREDSASKEAQSWQWHWDVDSAEERVHAVVQRRGDSALVVDVIRGTYRQRTERRAEAAKETTWQKEERAEDAQRQASYEARDKERERHAGWALYIGLAIVAFVGLMYYRIMKD